MRHNVGALIAAAWASMVAIGSDGFERLAKGIAATCDALRAGIFLLAFWAKYFL